MITSPEILKALKISSLLHGVPNELLAQCMDHSTVRSLQPGETLLEAGQVNELIYIVLAGHLKIQAHKTQVDAIAMLGEGECVGEMSILGDGYTSAHVIAATDCELLVLRHDALWKLINGSHVAARNMLSILTNRIRVADQRLAQGFERRDGFSGVSIVDELTGLYNYQWTQKKFDRLLQRSIFGGKPSSLMIMEMDLHREYVLEHGQLGADQAQRSIAYNILYYLRPDDHAGCYAGEKFAVYLPNSTQTSAVSAAGRLRSVINNAMVVLPSGDALPPVTVSFGLSQAKDEDTLASLFARADGALKQAQDRGGNRIETA